MRVRPVVALLDALPVRAVAEVTHRYIARDGRVYVKETGKPEREAGTALSASGRDLERFEKALNEARRQREESR